MRSKRSSNGRHRRLGSHELHSHEAGQNRLFFLPRWGKGLSCNDPSSDFGRFSFKAAQGWLQRHGQSLEVEIVDGPLSCDTYLGFLRSGEREDLVLVFVERMHQFR